MAKLTASEFEYSNLGNSVSVSSDGLTVVTGAPIAAAGGPAEERPMSM